MEPLISFGLWLKERRKRLDLTQADLANCVGCSMMTIRKIEADERRPSRQIAELLANCLDIPVAERPTFLKVARAELRVDRLTKISPTEPADRVSGASPPRLTPPLPTPLTPLVGREHELAAIAGLLQDTHCRLLTLVGPGGIGKTRLALEAAANQQAAFANGVYFASLAGVGSAEFIVPTIANGLGFAFAGPTDPKIQLLTYLRDKHLLLVIDNLEHLLGAEEATTSLGDMLQVAPRLKLLVTSRERLNLQGEWVFEVQGLPLPPLDQVESPAAYSAMTLFVQSAQRLQADFNLTAETQPAVAHICRLLGGLPLGIELAAAWVRMLSCQEIASEIGRSLDFLAASTRDAPERHRSIKAVFDHSWQLLRAAEQGALRQLSVFRGGFRREAAEVVAGATLPILSALVDKSLLRRSAAGRYDLHELIRQYAATHLAANAPEEVATRDRHCSYYARLLQERAGPLQSHLQQETAADLNTEIDNLRQGWDWAVRHGKLIEIKQSLETLFWLYELRCWSQEGVAIFGRAVERLRLSCTDASVTAATEQTGALAQALAKEGWFCFRQGRYEQALDRLRQSLDLLRSHSDQVALANTLTYLGIVSQRMGDYTGARHFFNEGLTIKQSLGDPWGIAFCLTNLGIVAYALGEYGEVERHLREALPIWRTVGDPRGISFCLIFYGPLLAQGLGRHAEGRQVLREGLAISQASGDRWGMATALNHLGLVITLEENADLAEAQQLLHESLVLYKAMDDRWGMARVLSYLGHTTYALGDYTAAQRYLLDGIRTALEAQVVPIALEALLGVAILWIKEGTIEAALELLMHILNHPASRKETINRAGQLRAELEAQLLPQQLEAVQGRVRARSFTAVVQEIVDTVATPYSYDTNV